MNTATVRESRNHYTHHLSRVQTGGEIVVTQRGEPMATLVPIMPETPEAASWKKSPAVTRNRTDGRVLSAQKSLNLIHEAASTW